MRCPACEAKTRVLETRETRRGPRRRHECQACGHRFSTLEILLDDGVIVVASREASGSGVDLNTQASIFESAEMVADEAAERIEQTVDAKLDSLADDVVDRLLDRAEAERRAALDGRSPLELVAGDDEWSDDESELG